MTQAVVRAIALPLEANAGSDASETSQTPEEPPTTCEPLIAFTLAARMRAHAMLHQLNRDRDEHGQVVASLDDYEVMRGIGGGVLSEGVAATVPDVVRQTVEAVNELDKPNAAGEYEGVQASAIADHLKLLGFKESLQHLVVAGLLWGFRWVWRVGVGSGW